MSLGFGFGLGFSQGGAASTPRSWWIDGGASFGPSYETISGIASYPSNDYEVTGSGTSGTKTFTRSGGDPLSDLGSNAVFVVMEDASGNLRPNVARGFSGSDVTLLYDLDITATKMHQGYTTAGGQHLSPEGQKCLAQHVLNWQRQYAYLENPLYALYHDDNFSALPLSAFVSEDVVWKTYNLATAIIYSNARNTFQSTAGNTVISAGLDCIRVTAQSAGAGAESIMAINGQPCYLSFTIGSDTGPVTLNVSILHDNVEVSNTNYDWCLNRVNHIVPAGVDEVKVRVTIVAGTFEYIRIGQMFLCDLTNIAGDLTSPVVNPNDKVLVIGDSWFDDANVNGQDFDAEFRRLHGGTVINRAIGGSVITDWNDDYFNTWLPTDKPDTVLFHSTINDVNANVTGTNIMSQIKALETAAKNAGAQFVNMSQGTTASTSAGQEHLVMSNQFESNLDKAPVADRIPSWDITA
jgi:hypothetical protein